MTRVKFLLVAIMTLITVISWVVFETIHARSQVNIPSDIEKSIKPLNPNFDTNVLGQ